MTRCVVGIVLATLMAALQPSAALQPAQGDSAERADQQKRLIVELGSVLPRRTDQSVLQPLEGAVACSETRLPPVFS